MGLLAKAEYEFFELPFKYFQEEGDDEAGIINIVAYGKVHLRDVCCFALYVLNKQMYKN